MMEKGKADRSIAQILDTLKKASDGDYSAKVGFASKNDDLGMIADAVNTLLAKTDKRIVSMTQFLSDLAGDAGRYRNIIDGIEESYFEVDLKGNLQFFNDRVMVDLGYSEKDLQGMHFYELVDQANAKILYDAFHSVFLTGQPVKSIEWKVLKKNKETIDVEASISLRRDETGKPVGFRGVVRDVSQRKKTEAELRQSEQRYRTILDITEEGYVESDLTGRITFANDMACRLMGYENSQLIGRHYRNYLTPLVAQQMYEVFHRIYATGKPELLINYDLIRHDGTAKTYQMNAALRYDAAGQPYGFRILFRDMSMYKQAREALHESEEKYRSILESMDETYLETDLQGKFLLFNDSFCRLLGYSREELHDADYRLISPPGNLQIIYDAFNEIYRTGKTRNFNDHELLAKDESIVYLDMSIALLRSPAGEPIGFGGLGRDVTEKVKVQRKIEESERHLRLITDNISDIIWTMDFNLNWTYLSPSVFQLTGFTPEEVIKLPLKIIFPPAIYSQLENAFKEELAREIEGNTPHTERIRTFEMPMMRKDGSQLWVEISANFNRDENGKPFELVGVTRNISERKRTQDKLRESEELYRKALETTNDGVAIIQDGRYVYFNARFLKTMGIPEGHAVEGEPLGSLIHPDDREGLKNLYLKRMRGEATPGKHEVRVTRPDGNLIYLQVTTVDTVYQEKPALLNFMQDITERRLADDALRESEKRYRMMSENINDIVWQISLDLKFIYASPSHFRVTGFSPEEVQKMSFQDFIAPESFTRITQTISEELALEASGKAFDPNRSRTLELEIYSKEGHKIWFEVNATFNRDESGKPTEILAVGRNITERRQMERKLAESEKRYRMIVDNMSDTIWTMDFNLQYTYLSPAIEQLTGYTVDEIKTVPLDRQLTPSSMALVGKIISEEFEPDYPLRPKNPDTSRTIELEVLRKDGNLLWQELTLTFKPDDKGNPVEILGVARDISDRKKAQSVIAENEKLYRMIVENMHEIIWTTDLNMNNTYMSPSCYHLTGYTPEELMLLPLDQLLTPESFILATTSVMEELNREYSGEAVDPQRSKTLEQEVYRKDGGTIWLEVTATFIRDAEGKATGMLMAGRDITVRKKAEEEKSSLERQLMQAQKMETVGRLAGGVAHDFNNMLSVILGYVDLAKLRLAKQHPVLKDIAEIEKAALRSRDITTQLLAFSRKQVIEPKIIDLNELVAHTQKAMIRLIGEDVEMKVVPEKNLWNILFDPSQIEQILINLAVNARDAMPDGGKLTIETKNMVLDDFYCRNHVDFRAGSYVRLTVSDNGTGMDKDTLQHIFEPFFTTKEAGKGTGLGLATVYGIVKQNEGFLNVYSEPGSGTTFSIYLPRTTEVKIVQAEAEEEPEFTATGNILLVEDDAMVLQITKGMLESIGYTVTAVGAPMEAISLYEKLESPVDLVITDVVMPGMSGKELRDKFLKIRPETKVLFMSGYTADVIARHGVLEEGLNFLQKPFTIKALALKVADVIAK